MALHAAKGSGKITSGVNPLSGQTVKHSAKAWKGIVGQYVKKYGPLDVTAPMGPYDVASSINAATRQKFDPQYKTLADQTSASNQQDKNFTNYYANYRAQLNDAQAKSAAADQAAQNFSTNMANSSSALDAQQRGVIAQQNQASATARGATVDPNQALVGQQADQSRRQNLTQQGALNAQQGANTQTYFGGRQATTSGQELAGHQAEATRRQNISKAVQALQSSEGDYRTTLRQQIQASERQNQLARATFGLNQAKAASTAATAQAAETGRNTRAAAGRATTERGQNLSHADRVAALAQRDAAQRRTASRRGASGGLTPTQVRGFNSHFDAAYTFLNANHPDDTRSDAQILTDLLSHGGRDYSATRAAYNAWRRSNPRGQANRPAGSRPG